MILVSTITTTTHASSTFVRQRQHSTTTINNGDTFTNNRLLRKEETSDKTPPFDYLDSEAIHMRVQELAKGYPQFTTLYTSQETYGLPSAGKGKDDCPYDKDNDGCINWILVIEDLISHEGGDSSNNEAEDSDNEEEPFSNLLHSYRQLPEVLLSGCLHGNERVGPTTVVETATLLLEVISCEASLHQQSMLYSEKDSAENSCQDYLKEFWGVSDITRRWLSRLVSTRRIVIVPTANALGYYRNQREEDGIDPNRDFPFDLEDYSQCMQTVAARTLNEVFRDHLFQLSFTFHGGMEAIGYEWGAPSYEGSKASISPDDVAQSMLASRYSWYGGEFPKGDGHFYPYGDMNGLVYPVRGGMEDWAYGASWDKEHTQPCIPNPDKYGEYDTAKTTYDESTLRVFNMLVETSNSKEPKSKYLGTRENLFLPSETQHEENGHVNRNIRLSLMLIDMVQPYLSITSVRSNPLLYDIIPSTQLYQTFETCTSNSIVVDVPLDGDKEDATTTTTIVPIEWTAGGAFDVDETYVMYGRTSDFRFIIGSCDIQPMDVHWDAVDEKMLNDGDLSIRVTEPIKGGRTRWHAEGPNPIDMIGQTEQGGMPADPIFRAHLELPITMEKDDDDPWMAIAVGTFDSQWSTHPHDLSPQSHVVNARTNPKWYHESSTNGKMIVGRTKWISLPIRFRFLSNEGIETQEEKEAEELPEQAIPPHETEEEQYRETPPEQHEQEAYKEEQDETQYEESVHSTETSTTPNRDRAKEESAEQQSKSSSSWFHKSEGDEPVEEPPSLSLFHLILFTIAAIMMMLAIQRIWTQKSSRKRRYRKTGRLPTVGSNNGPSEFETVALASHEGSSVQEDTELDLEEFESENPFAHPDNEGEFVQVVASAGYHNQKVMHI